MMNLSMDLKNTTAQNNFTGDPGEMERTEDKSKKCIVL